MTLHAEEEMSDDELSILDVEHAILNGEIIERQKDQRTHEWKYVIEGTSKASSQIHIIAKFSPTGKLVIITIYSL